MFGIPENVYTGCEFPYTYDDEALEVLRNAEDPENVTFPVDRCSQTFGQVYGVPWVLMQVALIVTGLVGAVVFTVRLIRLKRYAHSVGKKFKRMIQFKIFACGLGVSVALALEALDPVGYFGFFQDFYYVYFILDEIIAGLCFVLAMLVCDFWATASRGLRRAGGLPIAFKYGYTILAFLVFVGLQLVSMLVPESYTLFGGIKELCGVVLIVVLGVISYKHVKKIERSLTSMRPSRSNPALATSGSSGSSGVGTDGKKSKKELHDRLISQLRAKYRRFFSVMAFACIVLTYDGIDNIIRNEPWQYNILDTLSPIIVAVLKAIYIAVVVVVISFFSVPAVKVASDIGPTSNVRGDSTDGVDTNSKGASSFLQQAPIPSESHKNKQVAPLPPGPIPGEQILPPPATPRPTRRYRGSERSQLSIYDADDEEWQPSNDGLYSVLEDKAKKQRFLEFLTRKHAQENLLCWEAICDFENACIKKGENSKKAQKLALRVVEDFILPDAKYQVNVSAGNLESVENHRIGKEFANFSRKAFLRIKHEVFDILEENFYEVFMEEERKNGFEDAAEKL